MESGLNVQCANCGKVNSVDLSGWEARPRCGGCNSLLVKSGCLPTTVTWKDWDSEVLASPLPVVAWFWGPNCGVCANYELSVRRFAADFFGLAKVVSINAEENEAVAERYALKGVPTIMIFSGGSLVRVMEGPQGERGIREVLEALDKV